MEKELNEEQFTKFKQLCEEAEKAGKPTFDMEGDEVEVEYARVLIDKVVYHGKRAFRVQYQWLRVDTIQTSENPAGTKQGVGEICLITHGEYPNKKKLTEDIKKASGFHTVILGLITEFKSVKDYFDYTGTEEN